MFRKQDEDIQYKNDREVMNDNIMLNMNMHRLPAEIWKHIYDYVNVNIEQIPFESSSDIDMFIPTDDDFMIHTLSQSIDKVLSIKQVIMLLSKYNIRTCKQRIKGEKYDKYRTITSKWNGYSVDIVFGPKHEFIWLSSKSDIVSSIYYDMTKTQFECPIEINMLNVSLMSICLNYNVLIEEWYKKHTYNVRIIKLYKRWKTIAVKSISVLESQYYIYQCAGLIDIITKMYPQAKIKITM